MQKAPRMYWNTDLQVKIIAQFLRQLSLETGTWRDFNEDSDEAVVGGKYFRNGSKKIRDLADPISLFWL